MRMLALVFLSAVIILILPSALPSPSDMQEQWFIMLCGIEIVFLVGAALTRTIASIPIVGFCCWNILGHLLGYCAFLNDSPVYNLYEAIIRAGEVCQLLALILFSQPILRLAIAHNVKKRDRDGNHHRMAQPSS